MKTKFGHMTCPDCPKQVVVKINERKTLSYTCPECDSNGYCKDTEARYATWVGRITPVAPVAPAPKAAKEGNDPPPPPPPKKAEPAKMPWER